MTNYVSRVGKVFRFRLATMFLVITACSVWLGWVSHHARTQRDAVAGLERRNVQVNYSYQETPEGAFSYQVTTPGPAWLRRVIGDDYFRTAVSVTATAKKGPITDDGMRYLAALPHLNRLYVSNSGVSDAGLPPIADLTRLTSLTLRGGQITDDGLRHLRNLVHVELLQLTENQICGQGLKHLEGMTGLKTLYMYKNPLSDEGLAHIARLANLESLGLSETNLTDQGLTQLRALSKLKVLSLNHNRFSDEAVEPLSQLHSLERLELSDTGITPDGIAKLRAALPHCTIQGKRGDGLEPR